MRSTCALAAVVLLTPALLAQSPPRVLDLGHTLSTQAPTWSGKPAYSREGTPSNGKFSTEEHFSTHLDAPSHFGGAWTVDKIPADRLVRPAVCLNITAQAAKDEDYRLSVADILAFEKQHGVIPEGVVVLVAS